MQILFHGERTILDVQICDNVRDVLLRIINRRIVKFKSGDHFHESIGISYTTILDEFKKLISPFVDDVSIFGTHSIKSGAASNPACRTINYKHAGWKCPKTKKRYIKHVPKDLLNVSKAIGL